MLKGNFYCQCVVNVISVPVLVRKVSRVQGAVKRSHVSLREFLVAVRREFEYSCVSCHVGRPVS